MNILAYVHLRNIHDSTGAGRVARQVTEQLARFSQDELRILADPRDHNRIVHKVGLPWTRLTYHFFESETSRQQARWLFTGRPRAEHYWPEAEIVYCTAESYVPTRKSRLVVTLHDAAHFETNVHQASRARFKQHLKWKYLYWVLARKADLFHTVSNFSAERIAHFVPSLRSRLRVVHNAVTERFFQPVSHEGEEFLRRNKLADRPFILLPRGLHHRKNAELIVQGWPILHQQFPELKLVVTSHCEPFYEAKAKALGDSVVLTGFVSDEALCSLYHRAEVVWFPSVYEGFGLPVLEAMACGTPVVASDSSSLPEVAGDAALLVSTSDTGAHVEAIEAVLTNSGLRSDLSQRGKVRASGFTWQRAGHELHGHFLSLV